MELAVVIIIGGAFFVGFAFFLSNGAEERRAKFKDWIGR